MENQKVSENYIQFAKKEIGNSNFQIDCYAKLIVLEYQKLISNQITLEDFKNNTPEISEDTQLNYIRNKVIEWYPN